MGDLVLCRDEVFLCLVFVVSGGLFVFCFSFPKMMMWI